MKFIGHMISISFSQTNKKKMRNQRFDYKFNDALLSSLFLQNKQQIEYKNIEIIIITI